jgi:phosphopantetheine adenylyltransferase
LRGIRLTSACPYAREIFLPHKLHKLAPLDEQAKTHFLLPPKEVLTIKKTQVKVLGRHEKTVKRFESREFKSLFAAFTPTWDT